MSETKTATDEDTDFWRAEAFRILYISGVWFGVGIPTGAVSFLWGATLILTLMATIDQTLCKYFPTGLMVVLAASIPGCCLGALSVHDAVVMVVSIYATFMVLAVTLLPVAVCESIWRWLRPPPPREWDSERMVDAPWQRRDPPGTDQRG